MTQERQGDGYLRELRDLLDPLARAALPAHHLRVLLAVLRKTLGFQRSADRIAVTQLVRATGIPRRNLRRILDDLVAWGVLLRTDGGRGRISRLAVVPNASSWNLGKTGDALALAARNVARSRAISDTENVARDRATLDETWRDVAPGRDRATLDETWRDVAPPVGKHGAMSPPTRKREEKDTAPAALASPGGTEESRRTDPEHWARMLAGRRFRGDLDAARRWVDSVLDELEALAEVKADPAVDRRGWTSALKSLLWSRSRRLDLDQPRRPGPHRIVRRSSEADWARWKAENPGRGFEP